MTYRGRRVTMISAWGVEGQPPPAIESPGSQTPAEIPRGDRGVHQMEITGASRAASSPSQPSAVPQPPRWGDKCLIRPGIPAQLRRLAAIGSSSSFPSLAPSSTAATSASRSVRSLANAHESGPRRSSAIKPSTTRFDGSRFPELLPGEIQRHHCSGGSPRRSLRDEN